MRVATRDRLRPLRIPGWSATLLGAGVLLVLLPAGGGSEGRPVVHTMRPGDTVWAISSRHGVDAEALERLNHLEDVRSLPVGLRLVIPPPDAAGQAAAQRRVLADAFWALRRARFEEAQQTVERGRGDLHSAELEPALEAQLALVSASVELAFGRRDEALAHMTSALRSEPGLALDASTTSPKLVELLDEARAVVARRAEPALE